MYLSPVYDKEDLKVRKLSKNASNLQTLQNRMIRVILGVHKKKHVNMQEVRYQIKMMSVNQMNIYHTLIEAHNIMRNTYSEQIKSKWESQLENNYSLRSTVKNYRRVPEKPSLKCTSFSYYGAKLFNMLPNYIKETSNRSTFKSQIKE